MSPNSEYIGSAITQGFSPYVIKQQPIVMRETQDLSCSYNAKIRTTIPTKE